MAIPLSIHPTLDPRAMAPFAAPSIESRIDALGVRLSFAVKGVAESRQPAIIADALASLPAAMLDALPFRFAADEPSVTVLWTDGTLELAVVGWLPGLSSPVQDHGRSVGAILVAHGAIIEEHSPDGGRRRTSRRWRRGERVLIPEGHTHRVYCPPDAAVPAVTLHAYTLPLDHADGSSGRT